MAQFVIEIPDDKVTAVIEAFCTLYKYQEKIGEEPNPETKAQFAKRMVRQFIKEVYVTAQTKSIEVQRASIITSASAEADSITVN